MDIQEIKTAITQLSAEQTIELSAWLEGYLAQAWDRQIESDLTAGRLDSTLAEVNVEYDQFLKGR